MNNIKKSRFFFNGLIVILVFILAGCGVNSNSSKKLNLTPVDLTDNSAFFAEYYGLKLTMGSNISAAFKDSNLIVVGRLDKAVPATELIEPNKKLDLEIRKKDLTYRDQDYVHVTVYNPSNSAISIAEAEITEMYFGRLTSDASNKELYECSTTTINGIAIGTKIDDIISIFSKYENLAPHYTNNYYFVGDKYNYLFSGEGEENGLNYFVTISKNN